MSGFFSIEEIQNSINRDDETVVRTYDCLSCGLYTKCAHGKQSYTGLGEKKLLVIGDPVNHIMDQSNGDRKGSKYAFLKSMFSKHGIDIEKDCWYLPGIRCYTKDTKYSVKTMDACSRLLVKDIASLKPQVIVTTSESAWDELHFSTMRGRAANASYFDWCGEQIPSQNFHAWIVPIYDTELMMKAVDECKEKQKAYGDRYKPFNRFGLFYEAQLKSISSLLSKEVPIYDIESPKISTDLQSSLVLLDEVATWKKLAFDIETSGIKPHKEWHFIHSISFSSGTTHIAVMWWNDQQFVDKVRTVLSGNKTLIAHNIAFERSWMLVRHGILLGPRTHDSMIAQHCLRNDKPVGLKFCTYARLGILGYDGDIDQFLKSSSADEKIYGKNAKNNINKAPIKKVLKYGATDSAVTFWIMDQMLAEMDIDAHMPGYKFFMDSEKSFSIAHQNGILLDDDKIQETIPILQMRIDIAYKKIMDDPWILHHWPFGKFNPKSDSDVRKLVYDLLKKVPTEFTENGLPSVDVDTLMSFKEECPIIIDVIALKKAHKLLNTYIAQFQREQVDGVVHTFFNLHTTKTFRSSANAPSFQNISKRDKESKKIIRTPLHTLPGHRIVEIDVKGAEVSIAAAVSGDANLQRYVCSPSLDMHKDLAAKCFWMDDNDVPKTVRGNVIKGPFTFSQFYGSHYKNSAAGIYEEMSIPNAIEVYGVDLIKLCKDHGIKTFHTTAMADPPSDWEKHIQDLSDYLWKDMFPDYMEFRKDSWTFYQNHGYIDFVTGFRYTGVASKNELANAPVQGPAYHVQQWCFNYITNELQKRKMQSFLIGSIHDAIIGSVYAPEEVIFDMICWDAFQKVREFWPWITVPIFVEKERSAINGNWAEMESCGFLKDPHII